MIIGKRLRDYLIVYSIIMILVAGLFIDSEMDAAYQAEYITMKQAALVVALFLPIVILCIVSGSETE